VLVITIFWGKFHKYMTFQNPALLASFANIPISNQPLSDTFRESLRPSVSTQVL
jgi:hypothetical protein